MREIIFKGKRTDNGKWVTGLLARYNPKYEIANMVTDFDVLVPVYTETVGQFTGLTDNNGNKIFEGDIVKSCEYDDIYTIKYFDVDNYPAFDCVPEVPLCECNGLAFLVNTEGCEIIGNIHDNPELLKGVKNVQL